MNFPFLKIISESYVLDNPGINVTQEQVFNELTYIAKTIQQEDPGLYNEIYELEKVRQQQLLKCYIDNICESSDLITNDAYITEDLDEAINEFVDLTIVLDYQTILISLSAIITMLSAKPLTKYIFKAASIVGKGLTSLGKSLSKQGKYATLRYSIIQENSRRCYVKCGLTDMSKLHLTAYMGIKQKTDLIPAVSREQAWCLRDCFLDSVIEIIALHMENYFACLKKTGGSAAISQTDSDDIMRMISNVNLSTACEGFYKEAKKGLDDFYSTIDLVFDKADDDKKLLWVNKLRSRIYDARNEVKKPSFPQSNNQPQFQQKSNQPFQKYSK
jgi:hypothetical protein